MSSEGIWKAAAWLASAAVAVACILKTGNADFLQILAFPFFCLHFDLKEAETMTEKSAFDKALGVLHDLIEWEDAEAAIRELHARQPEMERLYLDGKILPGELQALVMVSNCLEREFIHRQLATGRPLHLNI